MCGEGFHDAGGADVPEENGFIVGAADEHVALWGEGDLVDVVVVADEGDGVRFALCAWLLACARANMCSRILTVDTFHRRMVLSSEPDAMVAPSGLHAMVDTPARWPSNV